MPFSITQNTVSPALTTIGGLNNQILNCNVPTTILNAFSASSNVTYNWALPGNPIANLPTNTLAVTANTSQATSTIIAIYTLTIRDINNQCATNTVIPMYQNFFKPNALISNGGQTALSCAIPTIALTNQSSSGIPANSIFTVNKPVIGKLWTGPAPSPVLTNTSTYVAGTGGTYTMLAHDLNNGCEATATITVGDNRTFPNITVPNLYTITCPNGFINMVPSINENPANLVFSWIIPPGATAMGLNTPTLTANSPGTYTMVATNTLTGCKTTSLVGVWDCVGINERQNYLNAVKIYPNPNSGVFNIVVEIVKLGTEIRIYNTLGEMVYQQQIFKTNNQIYIEHLHKGMYFMTVDDGNNQSTARMIKE